jgi:import receptor subunit TOM20
LVGLLLTSVPFRIYDKTVPKAVLDVLAEMIAADPELNVGSFGEAGMPPTVALD